MNGLKKLAMALEFSPAVQEKAGVVGELYRDMVNPWSAIHSHAIEQRVMKVYMDHIIEELFRGMASDEVAMTILDKAERFFHRAMPIYNPPKK